MESFKIPLISERREAYLMILIASLLISLHLGYIYKKYLFFKNAPFVLSSAKVLSVYPDREGDYVRVKLYSDKTGVFYSRIYGIDRIYSGDSLRLFVYPPKRLNFFKFLRGSSYRVKVASYSKHKTSLVDTIAQWIAKEHKSQEITNFYQAIYLALPLDKRLRREVSAFGISHLIALSGFHLGIISSVILLFLTPVYSFFQSRYFPYRSRFIDMGAIVLLLLFFYIYITGYPPSLLRAYSMMIIGWLAILGGIEIFNFATLICTVFILLILLPEFIVSKAFWLSVAGVFYIFILLKSFVNFSSLIVKLISLPVGIFILMSPLIHSIFPETTIYQLLSPLLSVLFVLFYPLSIILHLVGLGWVFDTLLLKLFSLNIDLYSVSVPLWFTIIYTLLSILAIYRKYAVILLYFTALVSVIYIYTSISY